jgi:hypothetical protein
MIISQSNKIIYTGYQVSSTSAYVYDDTGASDIDAGWFTSKYDNIVMQISCATLTATAMYYQVEGKFDGMDRPARIVEASINSVHDMDELIEISETVKEIRVGTKVNAIASPLIANNVLYCGLVLSEKR